MAVNTISPSIAATPAAASGSDASALGRARLAENFDSFLSLLTTQLKNQDPLSPLDSNQFTQQLVQMTGVEQQLFTNDLLKKLVANSGTGISGAVSLIGKDVRAEGDTTALSGGKANWIYSLDRAAADVKLEVLNDRGRVVRALAPTDNRTGEHTLTWDGKGDGGQVLPDGVYTLRVTAKDGSGATILSKVYADGTVTGVEQSGGQTLLSINGAKVSWDKIVQIRQPPAPVAAAPNPTPNTPPGGGTPPPGSV